MSQKVVKCIVAFDDLLILFIGILDKTDIDDLWILFKKCVLISM